MIPKGQKENFETLKRAIIDGNVVLMEVQDIVTSDTVDAVCAVNQEGENYEFVPLAFMIRGDPYRRFLPPDPDNDKEFVKEIE